MEIAVYVRIAERKKRVEASFLIPTDLMSSRKTLCPVVGINPMIQVLVLFSSW